MVWWIGIDARACRNEFFAVLNDGFGMDLTDLEFEKLIRRIDVNNDGTVNLMEWFIQFAFESVAGPPGAAAGIPNSSWSHSDTDIANVRSERGSVGRARRRLLVQDQDLRDLRSVGQDPS